MLSALYPAYEVSLIARGKKGKKIRIRPSRIFVDLPWIVYHFVADIAEKIKEENISAKEVKNLWNEEIKKNEKLLTVNGKPFVLVRLRKHSFYPNLAIIQIKIDWEKFFEFYEKVSKNEALKVIRKGKYIREIYNDILFNALSSASIKAFEIKFMPREKLLRNFIKVLKYSKDFYQVEKILNNILVVINRLHQQIPKKYGINWKLFTWQLKTDWINLHKSWQRVDIPTCYFYLRNILELLLKIALYKFLLTDRELNKLLIKLRGKYKMGFLSQKDIKEVLIGLLFEAERRKKGRSIKKEEYEKWKQNFKTALINVAKEIPNLLNITDEVERIKQNKRLVKELNKFCPSISSPLIGFVNHDLKAESYIENLWTICSEIVHNQPPLPFYSLYEIKTFKNVLEYYFQQISSFCEECLGISKSKAKYKLALLPKLRFNIIREQANLFLYQYRDKIKDKIKEISSRYSNKFWFNPKFLSIIFEIWGPSPSKMYKEEISYEDFLSFVENLQLTSYRVGIRDSVVITFQIFQKELQLFLFSLGLDKTLSNDERKVLLFLLLSLLLPESIK
jgi:hypothetical protein